MNELQFPVSNLHVPAIHGEAARYAAYGIHSFLACPNFETELGGVQSSLTFPDTEDSQRWARYAILARHGGVIVGDLQLSIDFLRMSGNCAHVSVVHKEGSKPSLDHRISDSLGRIYVDFLHLLGIVNDSGFATSPEGAKWVGRLHPHLASDMQDACNEHERKDGANFKHAMYKQQLTDISEVPPKFALLFLLMTSIIQPAGYSASTCGYCSPKGERSAASSSKSYGAFAHRLSCRDYQALVDVRSRLRIGSELINSEDGGGDYIYKPDMANTCCPQYTIRLEEETFKPTRSQRQIVNRFATFVREGNKEGKPGYGPPSSSSGRSTPLESPPRKHHSKGKGKMQTFDLAAIFASCQDSDNVHQFEITLEPASFSQEKFELYKRYQISTHGDESSHISPTSFDRFLCSGSLITENSGCAEVPYGQYHQRTFLCSKTQADRAVYRLDGTLIAFGVLDILPSCVSSVYLVWHPDYSALQLGKVSAMREIALVRELRSEGIESMRYLYMGYYIHSCQKMKYKAEYQPSELLDPGSNVFYAWSHCKPLLESNERASFSAPFTPIDHQNRNDDNEDDLPSNFPGCLAQYDTTELLPQVRVIDRRQVKSLTEMAWWRKTADYRRKAALELIATLGAEVASRAVLYVV